MSLKRLWSKQVEKDFVKNINDTYTLNLAISVLEDREGFMEEIERLSNIINELENYLNEQVNYMTHNSIERMVAFDCCRHKLQELKESNDNG